MDVFTAIIVDFANKFLGQAPLLLGTVVLIGYLLLKKKWYEALAGFIKTYVGFRILQVGSGGLVTTFRPIIDAIYGRFNITAYVGDPYFGFTSSLNILESVNSLQFVAYVMLIAFLTNIMLVIFHKQTKIRSLYLTGHAMYMGSAGLVVDFILGP